MRKRITILLLVTVVAGILAIRISLEVNGRRLMAYGYTWEHYRFAGERLPGQIACNGNGLAIVGTDNGHVYRSTDSGETWSRADNGIRNCWIQSAAITPDGILYVGSGRGVYRSADRGSHWALANEGLDNLGISALAADSNGTVYACTSEHTLLCKESDCAQWERIDCGAVRGNCHRLALDSKGDIYVGTYQAKLFRSTDHGGSWENIPIQRSGERYGRIDEIVIAPSGTIYIRDEDRILRLRFRSHQWTELSAATPFTWLTGSPRFSTLAIADHGRLIAASDQGFFVSDNEGDLLVLSPSSARRFANPIPIRVWSITADRSGRLYAIANGSAVFCGIRTLPQHDRKP